MHGHWNDDDHELLNILQPDAILFVGDLGNGDIRLIKKISGLTLPTAVMLGNHDRGYDSSGVQLDAQLSLLGKKNCSWGLCDWDYPLVSVVGARPCSPGGGYFLSNQVKAVFGDIALEKSVERIVNAGLRAPINLPLIVLAHSGPTGLGSEASSICGRDWKKPSIDWGDKDLEISIDKITKTRSIDLVVFGHMHHQLKRGKGIRQSFYNDKKRSIAYLNAAVVPRKGLDENGNLLSHFSWVEFKDGSLSYVSHRWFRNDASLVYEEILL